MDNNTFTLTFGCTTSQKCGITYAYALTLLAGYAQLRKFTHEKGVQ